MADVRWQILTEPFKWNNQQYVFDLANQNEMASSDPCTITIERSSSQRATWRWQRESQRCNRKTQKPAYIFKLFTRWTGTEGDIIWIQTKRIWIQTGSLIGEEEDQVIKKPPWKASLAMNVWVGRWQNVELSFVGSHFLGSGSGLDSPPLQLLQLPMGLPTLPLKSVLVQEVGEALG